MIIEKVSTDCDLTISSLSWSTGRYIALFNESPSTLLYDIHIDYAPEMFYGTDSMCIIHRERLRSFIPIPGAPEGWWAVLGDKGMIWSPGA